MRENDIKDVEKARAALAERTNATTKTLKAREAALVRAEEKIAALTERYGHLEADVQVIRTGIEKRVEELNSALQRERMEHAMVAGALEATRKDNARLQSEVASLRSILQRGMALDGTAGRAGRTVKRRGDHQDPGGQERGIDVTEIVPRRRFSM